MTVDQFVNCLDGYKKRIESESKLTDRLNHIFGHYIMSAYHEPKKYPKESLLNEEAKPTVKFTTDEQRIKAVRMKYGKKK